MNPTKSEIMFNGVNDGVVQEILQVSEFRRGTFPFKYLGVPISHKKITKSECNILIDRLITRTKN